MKKKYDCPFFEVQKLTISDIICESDITGEDPMNNQDREKNDSFAGEGEMNGQDREKNDSFAGEGEMNGQDREG